MFATNSVLNNFKTTYATNLKQFSQLLLPKEIIKEFFGKFKWFFGVERGSENGDFCKKYSLKSFINLTAIIQFYFFWRFNRHDFTKQILKKDCAKSNEFLIAMIMMSYYNIITWLYHHVVMNASRMCQAICRISFKSILLTRSSLPEVFLGKGVLKICSKFKGQHPCRSVISTKLLCNLSAWVFSCKSAAYFQFVIFNLWKIPWNWIAFYQNSFVLSPD